MVHMIVVCQIKKKVKNTQQSITTGWLLLIYFSEDSTCYSSVLLEQVIGKKFDRSCQEGRLEGWVGGNLGTLIVELVVVIECLNQVFCEQFCKSHFLNKNYKINQVLSSCLDSPTERRVYSNRNSPPCLLSVSRAEVRGLVCFYLLVGKT